jgi:hypothetical protein
VLFINKNTIVAVYFYCLNTIKNVWAFLGALPSCTFPFFSLFPALLNLLLKERLPYDNVNYINTASYASRYFQRPATEMMSNIIDFHNDLMMVLIFISVFILVLLSVCLAKYATFSYKEFYLGKERVSRVYHDATAEVIFTAVPAAIIYSIAAPSFALLYSNND